MVMLATSRETRRGAFALELVVAMGVLVIVMIPLGIGFMQEVRTCRAHYYRAVAMEIIDGEMEVLAAGEWRAFSAGQHEYSVRAESSTNLPPGRFLLQVAPGTLALEWIPTRRGAGAVRREVNLR